jgi:hypothetical protein
MGASALRTTHDGRSPLPDRRAAFPPNDYRAAVARKKLPPVDREEARTIGALLRGLRRSAGFRAVQDAVADPACPAARQTIYAYERGGLVPSLAQFLELVEFYALRRPRARREAVEDLARKPSSRVRPHDALLPHDRGDAPDNACSRRRRQAQPFGGLWPHADRRRPRRDAVGPGRPVGTTAGPSASCRRTGGRGSQGVGGAAPGRDVVRALLGALGPETPVGRFLDRRGPGVHHVAYRVERVGDALEHLRAEGVRLIDEEPRPGSRGTTIAFVHPEGMGGVLVELVQEG